MGFEPPPGAPGALADSPAGFHASSREIPWPGDPPAPFSCLTLELKTSVLALSPPAPASGVGPLPLLRAPSDEPRLASKGVGVTAPPRDPCTNQNVSSTKLLLDCGRDTLACG